MRVFHGRADTIRRYDDDVFFFLVKSGSLLYNYFLAFLTTSFVKLDIFDGRDSNF